MENIKKINKVFSKKKKNINKYINSNISYMLKFDKTTNNILSLYNSNEKLLTFSYNFYGIITNKEFIWASSIYGINNEEILNNIKKIKSYKNKFKNKNDKISKFYYNLLTNKKISLHNDNEIELINKLLVYLNDDFYFINPKNSQNNIQIIGLNKIKEKYI